MNLESVPVGTNPPHDVNVIIEVPIGGEPIKYELDKASGTSWLTGFSIHPCAIQAIMGSFHTLSRLMAIHATFSSLIPARLHPER